MAGLNPPIVEPSRGIQGAVEPLHIQVDEDVHRATTSQLAVVSKKAWLLRGFGLAGSLLIGVLSLVVFLSPSHSESQSGSALAWHSTTILAGVLPTRPQKMERSAMAPQRDFKGVLYTQKLQTLHQVNRKTPPVLQMSSPMEESRSWDERDPPPVVQMSSPMQYMRTQETYNSPAVDSTYGFLAADAVKTGVVSNSISIRKQPDDTVVGGNSGFRSSTLGWLSILAVGTGLAAFASRAAAARPPGGGPLKALAVPGHFQTAAGLRLGAARCPPIRCSASQIDFDAAEWTRLQSALDAMPIFTCVNANNEPLGYERDGKPLGLFFADIDQAQQEVANAVKKFPELGLRMMSVGLGDVYKQMSLGQAVLVPSPASLAAAPDGWDEDQLPLYVCLAMNKPAADGSGAPTTPFFMDPGDAQRNMDAAVQAAKQAGTPLSEEQAVHMQLSVTSLITAVDLVLQGKEKETCGNQFQWVAPTRSVAFLQAAMKELEGRSQATPSSQTDIARKVATLTAEDNLRLGLIFPEDSPRL